MSRPAREHETREARKLCAPCGPVLARSCGARNRLASDTAANAAGTWPPRQKLLARRGPRSCAPPHLACRILCRGGGDGSERCSRQRVTGSKSEISL